MFSVQMSSQRKEESIMAKNLKVGARIVSSARFGSVVNHHGTVLKNPFFKEWGKVWCWIRWDSGEESGELRNCLFRESEFYLCPKCKTRNSHRLTNHLDAEGIGCAPVWRYYCWKCGYEHDVPQHMKQPSQN